MSWVCAYIYRHVYVCCLYFNLNGITFDTQAYLYWISWYKYELYVIQIGLVFVMGKNEDLEKLWAKNLATEVPKKRSTKSAWWLKNILEVYALDFPLG